MKNYLNKIYQFAQDEPVWFCVWFSVGLILGLGLNDLL